MFGPNSIIGYALVDFPVPLRRNLALFILKTYRHWNGLCPWSDPEFCTRVFVWLEAFCLWLALSLTYLILFNLLSGTFYGARACIRNLFSRPASKHTMPVQVPDQRMPNEISMPDRFPKPDRFPMPEDLLPPEDGLFIQVQYADGLKCAFLYFLKAKEDMPFLQSYCCNQKMENVSLIKDLSMITKRELEGSAEAPLRLWLRVRIDRGPEYRVAVTAMRMEPGWTVTKQRVYRSSDWPYSLQRGSLPRTMADSHVHLIRKTDKK